MSRCKISTKLVIFTKFSELRSIKSKPELIRFRLKLVDINKVMMVQTYKNSDRDLQ